jgi:hypothetical protein
MSAKKLNIPLSQFSDGHSVPIVPGAELKTNYKDIKKRYELAERVVWSKTPKWKQHVIASCKLAKKEDRILDEYAKEIVTLAESDDKLDRAGALPPVPSFDIAMEIDLDKGLTKK